MTRETAGKKTLSVCESLQTLVSGYEAFQQLERPSSLSGMTFIRIAGQAIGLLDPRSKQEVLEVVQKTRPGGAFLVLGHGGLIPCGAVAAKRAALELAKEGKMLGEHLSVRGLLENVSPTVGGKESPEGELDNAEYQCRRVLADLDFAAEIKRKNITVVAAVFSGHDTVFKTINQTWDEETLFVHHPKLRALRSLLGQTLVGALREGEDLSYHWAHAIMLYDPMLLRTVLDPFSPTLEVGGVCCVDARFLPSTEDPFLKPPNTCFDVTVGMRGGEVSFSYDDEGSITYALGHVHGVNSLNPHGDKGNGHIVCLDIDTDLSAAKRVRDALLWRTQIHAASEGGKRISLLGFDGTKLRVVNEAEGIDRTYPYRPRKNILSL